MDIKKFFTAATAVVLTSCSLIGCAGGKPIGDLADKSTVDGNVTDTAYEYTQDEADQLYSFGKFEDYENVTVGTKYEMEGDTTVSAGSFSYRPKWSVFQVVEDEGDHALKFQRNAVSNSKGLDPHFDMELKNHIKAGNTFVAEMDIKLITEKADIRVLQTIYRPAGQSTVFCAYLEIKNGKLSLGDKIIADIPVGEYVKIACVMDQKNGLMDVYVNGYMVYYGYTYIKSTEYSKNCDPAQIRFLYSNSGECTVMADNVAVYTANTPMYIAKVTESDIKTVGKFEFDSPLGKYNGEKGLTVSAGKSTFNIINTPDGRGILEYKATTEGVSYFSVSAVDCEAMWNYSTEIYLTEEYNDFSLAAIYGSEWVSVLEIRGTVLYDCLQNVAVKDIGVDQWVKVDLFVNGMKNTYDICVDGYRYIDDAPIKASVINSIISINVGVNNVPERDTVYYFDSIHLYNATDILGCIGNSTKSVEKVYTVISPDNYSWARGEEASEVTVTDEVKGTGANTLKYAGFTKRLQLGLGGTGLTKQATGDYDFNGIDAIRISFYAPQNAGRTFVLILDCGDVYSDANGNKYYDGTWKKNGNNYVSDKYPGVTATTKEWSYYNLFVTFDSEGWATMTVPRASFSSTRSPDWAHVESIRLEPTGWKLETEYNHDALLTDEKAVYYIDSVELIVYK